MKNETLPLIGQPFPSCDCGQPGQWRGDRSGHRVFSCAECFAHLKWGPNAVLTDLEKSEERERRMQEIAEERENSGPDDCQITKLSAAGFGYRTMKNETIETATDLHLASHEQRQKLKIESLAQQWKKSPLNRAFVTQKAKTCGQIHKGILTDKHEFDDELRATLEKMLRDDPDHQQDYYTITLRDRNTVELDFERRLLEPVSGSMQSAYRAGF